MESSPVDYEVGWLENAEVVSTYKLNKPCALSELLEQQNNKCESKDLEFELLSGVGFGVTGFNFAEAKGTQLDFLVSLHPVIPNNAHFRHYDHFFNATKMKTEIENHENEWKEEGNEKGVN